MVYVIVAVAWLVVGAAVGVIGGRHGDWRAFRGPAGTAALEIDAGNKPGSVILAGDPADALERYAIDDGYEVIVVGCRGKGLTKLLLGSCASRLACRTNVPVLLIPAEPAISASNASATSATRDTR